MRQTLKTVKTNLMYLQTFSGHKKTKIVDTIPPPELHIMFRIVIVLFNNMVTEFDDNSLIWAKKCNVVWEAVGNSAFAGNSCKILL